MAPSNLAIQQFIANNANVCPHSEVKSTRSGHCCKWIVLQARGRSVDVLRLGAGHLHALPAACMDSGSLQGMTLSKSAFPMPGDLQEVCDCMSIWGREISERWHQLVLSLMIDKKRTRKQLCRLCIQIRVNDLIADRLRQNPSQACHVLFQWHVAFDDMCEHVTKECFELCMRSFHHVVIKTNEALSPAGLTPILSSSEDEAEGDSVSEVICVPVVSSSSDV